MQARDVALDVDGPRPWYAAIFGGTIELPPVLEGRSDLTYGVQSEIRSSGADGRVWATVIINITFIPDLSRSEIRVTCEKSRPRESLDIVQRHFARPPLLSKSELINAHERYGAAVVAFCQAHMGQCVGRGECWDLADHALKSLPPEAMRSRGKVHGHIVFEHIAGHGAPVWGADATLRPGDVLQFDACRFEERDPSTRRVTRTISCGAPDHTSIVTAYATDSGCVDLLEQNSGGRRFVTTGRLALHALVSGSVRAYRPIWASWAE